MPSCLNNHVDIPQSRRTLRRRTVIRPTLLWSPREILNELDRQEAKHPDWQRTLACRWQTRGTTLSLRLGAVSSHENTDCEFTASGTTIEFEGHRAVLSDVDGDSENETEEELPGSRSR